MSGSYLHRASPHTASAIARRYCESVDAAMAEVGQPPPNWRDLWESDILVMLYFKVPPVVSGCASWPRALAKAIVLAAPQAAPLEVLFDFYDGDGTLEDIIDLSRAVDWLNEWADMAEEGDRIHGRRQR